MAEQRRTHHEIVIHTSSCAQKSVHPHFSAIALMSCDIMIAAKVHLRWNFSSVLRGLNNPTPDGLAASVEERQRWLAVAGRKIWRKINLKMSTRLSFVGFICSPLFHEHRPISQPENISHSLLQRAVASHVMHVAKPVAHYGALEQEAQARAARGFRPGPELRYARAVSVSLLASINVGQERWCRCLWLASVSRPPLGLRNVTASINCHWTPLRKQNLRGDY